MKSNKGRIALNSIWILLDIPGLYFGVLVGLGMFLAGKKVGEQRWKTTGCIYMAVLLILEIAFAVTKGKTSNNLATAYVIVYLIAVVHSIIILVKYIPRISKKISVDLPAQVTTTVQADSTKSSTGNFTVSKDLYSVANSAAPEKKANISFDNSYYDKLNVTASAINTQTSTKVEAAKKKAEKIDINTCTEKELASLPGVSIVAAKKAIAYRDKNNGFSSEQEFYKVAGIQLHFAKQIKDRIFCGEEVANTSQSDDSYEKPDVVSEVTTEIDPAPTKEKKGRVLDI